MIDEHREANERSLQGRPTASPIQGVLVSRDRIDKKVGKMSGKRGTNFYFLRKIVLRNLFIYLLKIYAH